MNFRNTLVTMVTFFAITLLARYATTSSVLHSAGNAIGGDNNGSTEKQSPPVVKSSPKRGGRHINTTAPPAGRPIVVYYKMIPEHLLAKYFACEEKLNKERVAIGRRPIQFTTKRGELSNAVWRERFTMRGFFIMGDVTDRQQAARELNACAFDK